MKKIVVINGSGEAGKDTFVMFFKENIYHRKIVDGYIIGDTYNISSVDKVKEIARKMGWNGTKDNTGRKFLSDLKDIWTEYNDGPFRSIITSVNFHLSKSNKTPLQKMYDGIFFLHIREPHEIQKIKDFYEDECTTLLIRRHQNDFTNHADSNVENYEYDYIVENYGTLDDLKKSVDKFINRVIIDSKTI